LLATYAALVVVLGAGVATLGADVRKFAVAFTVVFAIAYASWIAGSYAYIAAVTPAEQQKFGIDWSLKLTNEGGFIVALLSGLVIANFFPRFAEWLKEAVRPELYIKIAIVILGATVAVTAAGRLNLASSLLLRGAAAIVEAYLIYWAVIYYIARKWFGFSREWSVPLASGISICGVAAAIATGGAIRARPAVPILVSSLVVVFAVVEVLILPFLAQTFLWQEPLVAGAPGLVAGYRKLVEAVKPYGMRVFQQIGHLGNEIPQADGSPPWSSSDTVGALVGIPAEPMSKRQIRELVAQSR